MAFDTSVAIDNSNVDVVVLKTARDTDLYVSIMMPDLAEGETCPLVSVNHGFMGDRNEYGMFHGGAYSSNGLADELQQRGIATVRVDFPGSGDSTESFESYTISNMVSDMETAYNYVLENYPIDRNRLGVLGWSMGAKVTTKFITRHPEMKVMVLWSPAVGDGIGDLYFMKQLSDFAENEALDNMEYVAQLRDTAEREGCALLEQDYNKHEILLSKAFFDEIEAATPIAWINGFKGDKLAVMPIDDNVIPKKTYEILCRDTDIRRIYIDSDHDLGFENELADATLSAIEITVAYLADKLS